MDSGQMGDSKSDEWLPEGWRVEVKVRKNGKRDKFYFPPTGQGKFNSRLEVSRYLSSSQPKPEEKEKCIKQPSSKNVVVEKAIPEGLPSGWTKEVKITKKGGRVRRDAHYTDPVSGYAFRSMKDALRYLETGKSPSVSKKQKLADSGTRSPSTSEQSSRSFENAEDVQVPAPEHTSDQCVGMDSSSSVLREDKDFEKTEEKSDSTRSLVELFPDKQSLDDKVIKDGNRKTGIGKSRKNKDLHLPRRASKRLAGLPLDPTPELETRNRTRRPIDKHFNEIVPSKGKDSSAYQLGAELEANHTNDNSKNTKNLLEQKKGKHPIEIMNSPNEAAKKIETEKKPLEHTFASSSPPGNLSFIEGCAGNAETDCNVNEKPMLPPNLLLGELWQDPCIAFAIKILTGVSFDNPDSIKMSPRSSYSEFGGSATSEQYVSKEDTGNSSDRKQECTVVLPLGNLASQEEHARGVEVSNKRDEIRETSLDLPFTDAWADPCIEFAIKTLTGAIPLEVDMVIQDCLPKQASSSQGQQSRSLTLPDVGDFCETQFMYQQVGTSEKPLFNQTSLVQPALPHNTHVNLGYSGGTNRHQRGTERSGGC